MVLLIAGAIGLLSWWLTAGLARHAIFLKSIDHPNERSLHDEPTPRSGGIAILASVFVGLGVAAVGYAFVPLSTGFLPKGFASASPWMIGSIALVTIVSFIDDRRGLPVWIRFSVQAIAAGIVVWGVDLTLATVPIPGMKTLSLGWAAGPVSWLFLLWMTNLYNFMDGMDGFAGGMTTLGFGFLAYFGWRAGHPFMFLTTILVAMSAFGFLIHNFPPARIFMGDVGSIPLGFTAGTLILMGVRDGLFDLWVPIMIFSPFIMDATATVLRRTWQGEQIWKAHREHFYQRLVLSGWGHQRTVLAEYAIMVVCGVLAILYRQTDQWRLVILSLWLIMFGVLAISVTAFEQRVRERRSG